MKKVVTIKSSEMVAKKVIKTEPGTNLIANITTNGNSMSGGIKSNEVIVTIVSSPPSSTINCSTLNQPQATVRSVNNSRIVNSSAPSSNNVGTVVNGATTVLGSGGSNVAAAADSQSKRRIHKCQYQGCKKVYTKSSHLKAHLRTHTGKQ